MRPAILPGGRELARWVSMGGRPECASRFHTWLYRWRGFWMQPALDRLEGIPFPYPEGEGLVFIMGFWRSGTTLLHELLSALPGWEAPCTWQCMDPASLLLASPPVSQASIQRPMDQVIIHAQSPQEDEFALMAMGVPSVYRGFVDPRRLTDLEALLDQESWCPPEAGWLPSLDAFLSRCHATGAKRMVVKSPNHVFRYRSLVEHFPRAHFVWILRDPQALWTSNLRMWEAMIDLYGLWKAPEGVLEAFLIRAMEAFVTLLDELATEPGGPLTHVISFESMAAQPMTVLPRLLEELGESTDLMSAEGLAHLQIPTPRVSSSVDRRTEDTLLRLSDAQGRFLARG